MEENSFIVLKENNEEIRRKIKDANIHICPCAYFEDSDWLIFSTIVIDSVHALGYPNKEDMWGKEQVKKIFLEFNTVTFCNNVDEFINKIKESRLT